MNWTVVANFFDHEDAIWLDNFIEHDGLRFRKTATPRRHDWQRGGSRTGLRQWADHMRQAWAATRGRPDGIVTCFPPLAFCVALLRLLRLTRTRIVAHNFNLGSVSGRMRGRLAGLVLSRVDRFLVHSPAEIPVYASWLGLPEDRFLFVPLQRGDAQPATDFPTSDEPFIVSLGSANRDYKTLVEATRDLGISVKIVCKQSVAPDIGSMSHVEILSDLTQEQCWSLTLKARLSVVPIKSLYTAAGQVTFIDSMRLGTAVIATQCAGTQGYLEHLDTGILVEPFDVQDMADWIKRVWSDESLRTRIEADARKYYELHLSDQAAANQLRDILLSLKTY